MSHGPWSISRLLDLAQSVGEPPVVNPVKLVNGTLPVNAPRFDGPVATIVAVLLTVLGLTAILVVYLFSPPATVHFLYADF